MRIPAPVEPLVDLCKTAFERWSERQIYRLGAAFSYYATFSLFPFLLLVITAIGYLVGEGDGTRERLLAHIARRGTPVWELLDRTLRAMQSHTSVRGLSAWIGLLGLFFGASGAFGELDHTLNCIWGLRDRQGRGLTGAVWVAVREQLTALAIVAVLGLTLAASLLVTAAISSVSAEASPILGLSWAAAPMARVAEAAASLTLLTGVFLAAYHYIPRSRPPVRGLVGGAVATAVLLLAFKELAARYLMKLGGFSAYGVVGGVLALETWIFFSSQAIFLVAQFTEVYSERSACSSVQEARS